LITVLSFRCNVALLHSDRLVGEIAIRQRRVVYRYRLFMAGKFAGQIEITGILAGVY
jgi:hypothetical protein